MRALIPAAALGTRWYPWSLVVPKELLPLGNYPAIHYVLEEVVSAEICEIGIIISRAKELIKKYVEEIWKSDHSEVSVTWFYQSSPRGVVDALLCASDWVRNEPTAVLYPDEIHPGEGGLFQLGKVYGNSPGCWIGLTKDKQNRRQAIFQIEKIEENAFQVHEFSNKKRRQRIGYGTGRYILGSGLEYLIKSLSQRKPRKGIELDDTNVFSPLWSQRMRGPILKEPVFDIGTPTNWFQSITKLYQIHKES